MNKKMENKKFNKLMRWLSSLSQERRESLLQCTLSDTEELVKLFDFADEDDMSAYRVSVIAEKFGLTSIQLNRILCLFGIVRREDRDVILCDEFADFGKEMVWENRETSKIPRKYEKFYFRGVILIRNLWSNLRVAFQQERLRQDDAPAAE